MSPLMLLLAGLVAGAPADAGPEIVVRAPAPHVLAAPVIAERQLATMRGGIRLDNGFSIAIGVDIQTRVDGLLLLHTIYASDGPAAGFSVYTDGADGLRVAPGTVSVDVPASTGDTAVIVDRSPTGTTVSLNAASRPTTVNVVDAEPGLWLNADGQMRVPVVAGQPVTVGPGRFSVEPQQDGNVVTLDTAMLQIRHLIGQATGVVVANTANDRTIDTVSAVNVDLQGISPGLLSGLFAADALALDAMGRR